MLRVKAYSKINLFLNILDKRPDGYHNIESVMQSISLADHLVFSKADKDEIIYKNSPVGGFKGDLVGVALELMREETDLPEGTRIDVDKGIPVAAGLGGGSADAAATLIGLDCLYDLGLSLTKLRSLAEKIGADVPFFLSGSTQLAKGKGEILSRLKNMPRCWIVTATPPGSVSTSRIYKEFDEIGSPPPVDPAQVQRALLRGIERGDPIAVSKNLYNALEGVTVRSYPEILNLKEEALKAGADGVSMSGSGPTVFALVSSEEKAKAVFAALKTKVDEVNLATPCQKGVEVVEL